ncbi:MAG: hypothetical protein ACYS6K_20450 [Planctomycetota bacterium]
MSKRTTHILFFAFFMVIAFVGFLWSIFRNPYEPEFFTEPMQRKYQSVEAVIEAYSGHKGQSKNEIMLLNEAYGWERFDSGKVSKDTLPEEKSGEDTAVDTARQPVEDITPELRGISYYRSNKLAVANFSDGSATWLIWRDGRWVLYPETPWLPLLEMFHGVSQEDAEAAD